MDHEYWGTYAGDWTGDGPNENFAIIKQEAYSFLYDILFPFQMEIDYDEFAIPETFALHQNYPNPFNPSTTVKYDIGLMDGLEQRVSVNVYNVVGQHVTTLVNNVSQVGQFYVKWDGADKFGKTLPSGIYFVQLKTDSGIIKNKKMMFLK